MICEQCGCPIDKGRFCSPDCEREWHREAPAWRKKQASTPICEHCGKRPVQPNGVTCGNSWCQEARYNLNRARNAKSKQQRALFMARMRECEEKGAE